MRRREFILGSGVLLAAVGAEAAVGEGPDGARALAVMPPGTGTLGHLRRSCVACGLCMAACPEKVLVPAGVFEYGFAGSMMPKLDFRNGACDPTCTRCAQACPARVFARFATAQERARQRLGYAVWDPTKCRTTHGEECTLCSSRCPKQAIALVKDDGAEIAHPQVDADACVGCGKCENYCPAAGKAIRVRGTDPQDFAFGKDTLVAYCADGTEWTNQARGVKPLFDILDGERDRFAGARCYDRIVGRAAAFLYAKIGVGEVIAPVMSEGAVAILKRHGIRAEGRLLVPAIRNRKGDGMCPMDASVKDLADDQVDAAIAAIRETVAKMLAAKP